jgi:hypothetical protein
MQRPGIQRQTRMQTTSRPQVGNGQADRSHTTRDHATHDHTTRRRYTTRIWPHDPSPDRGDLRRYMLTGRLWHGREHLDRANPVSGRKPGPGEPKCGTDIAAIGRPDDAVVPAIPAIPAIPRHPAIPRRRTGPAGARRPGRTIRTPPAPACQLVPAGCADRCWCSRRTPWSARRGSARRYRGQMTVTVRRSRSPAPDSRPSRRFGLSSSSSWRTPPMSISLSRSCTWIRLSGLKSQ